MYELIKPPVVRRIEYFNDYLLGVSEGFDEEEHMVQLAETKKKLEREKSLAVGRGNPYKKGISKTKNLTYDCKRLCESVQFVNENSLTELGQKYLDADKEKRIRILCKAYSTSYPHLGVLLRILQNHDTITLPLRNKPPFRPEAARYNLNTHQVSFDTTRDFATELGLVNWYTEGKAEQRRQHIYKVCKKASTPQAYYHVTHENQIHYYEANKVNKNLFRETLWENYIELVNGVPGFPVFYSVARDHVCNELRISDTQFDHYTEELIEDDDKYNVIWSQGILPRKQDTASLLKSLPPKNIDGNYVIFLKIVRY